MQDNKLYICPYCNTVEDVHSNKDGARIFTWKTTKCHSCGKEYKRTEAKTTTHKQELLRKQKKKTF